MLEPLVQTLRSKPARRARFVLLVVLLGWAVLPPLSRLPLIRRGAQTALAWMAGYEVRLGEFRLGYDLSVQLGGLSVVVPGQPPFATAERVQVSLQPRHLLSGDLVHVRIEAPALYVARLPEPPPGSTGTGAAGWRPFGGAEVVGGYVYLPRSSGDVAIGPLTATIASAEVANTLRLTGSAHLTESATAAWAVTLGADVAERQGSLTIDVPRIGEVVRPWTNVALPAGVGETGLSLSFRLQGASADLLRLELDASVQPPGAKAPVGLKGKGTVDLLAKGGTLELTGSGLTWHDAALARAAEGIDLRGRLTAAPADRNAVGADVDLTVRGGELLWDRFYIDVREHPLQLKGRMRADGATFSVQDATASAGDVGTVTFSGSTGLDGERWRVKVHVPGVDPLFGLAARDPLKEDYPVLESTEVRGELSAAMEYVHPRDGRWRLNGTIDLRGGRITVPSPRVAVRDLTVQLPFLVGAEPLGTKPPGSGRVRVGELTAGDVTVADVALPLEVEPNRIALAGAVSVPILGGAVDLIRLDASGLAEPTPSLAVGLAVRQIDLALLSRALGWPTLSGVVTGEIPDVRLTGGQIRSDGTIRAGVFGGEVWVRNVRVDEILSPVPTLELDLDYDNLSLGELTGSLELGRVTGVVSGGVRDLAIVRGQPLRFEAWMNSVPRPGVPQRISVTAIRQLSILGGAGGDPLTQGLLRFFDEYRYAKMGFRCGLENDRFTLRGVEQHDGQEYLVVGAVFPPRVNVVSHTRVIAFSEMTRRIARIWAVREARTDEAAEELGGTQQR